MFYLAASARNAPPATAAGLAGSRGGDLGPGDPRLRVHGDGRDGQGMYMAGARPTPSFATGTILVVAVAMVGSLTVLPALLSWLGHRVEKGRVPLIGRLKSSGRGGRIWSATVDRVLRHPRAAALAAGGLLVALAIPAFSLHTANSGAAGLPKDLPVVTTYDRIQAAFPGGEEPARSRSHRPLVHPRRSAPRSHELVRQAAARDPAAFKGPATLDVSRDDTVAELRVPLAGNGTDNRSTAALTKLRDEVLPETVGRVPGVTAQVAGSTASSKDFNDLLAQRMPWVFAFVLGAAFLLLLVSFRSVVVPLTAIGLNLLSVGAAYGVVVSIFQQGHLEGLLDFHSTGAITSWLPLFLFVVLFGLSMDYHVFILSGLRIREASDRGMSTDQAVAHGADDRRCGHQRGRGDGRLFAIFATLSFLEFKELGVGLAAAILIDATVIRGVLLPATMKLLPGERNWYLPRGLRWLPQMGESAGRGRDRGQWNRPPRARRARGRRERRRRIGVERRARLAGARHRSGAASLGAGGRRERRHLHDRLGADRGRRLLADWVWLAGALVVGLRGAVLWAGWRRRGRCSVWRWSWRSHSSSSPPRC